jgi:hypothetical protein
MINPPSQQHKDGVLVLPISSSLPSRSERESLLQQPQQNESVFRVQSDAEDESENDTPSGALAAARQVFSTKLVAVMIDFFMDGVSGSSIGVRKATMHVALCG